MRRTACPLIRGPPFPPPNASPSATPGGASSTRSCATSTRSGPARAIAERDALDLAAHLGERLALNAVPLSDAVSMFVSARRPFLAELSLVARRRGVEAARAADLYDLSTGLLDRLLLAFVAAHEVASREASTAPGGPART